MEKREAAMKAITRNLDRGVWRDFTIDGDLGLTGAGSTIDKLTLSGC